MKKRFSFPFFVILIFIASCKSQKHANPGPQPTSDPSVYRGVTDLECALEVSFGSYAAGIDPKAYEKITALLDSSQVKYTAKNIGREGETRLCLPLKDMGKKDKNELITKLKKLVKEGDLVSISIR